MNDMNATTFGELLTALRKQHRMSQQALADKLDVHRNTVSKCNDPSFSTGYA